MVSVADVLPFARPSASGFASGPKINDAVEKRGRLSWITPFPLGRATAAPWALSRKRFAHPFDKPPSVALSLKEQGVAQDKILPHFMRDEDASPAYLNVETTECLIFVKRSRQANGPIVQAIQL